MRAGCSSPPGPSDRAIAPSWRRLSESVVRGVIWRHVIATGERPRVRDVAHGLGTDARTLRRFWRADGRRPLRAEITQCCVLYAWYLITHDVKCSAASRLAGFRSRWNFNRQAMQIAGRTGAGLRTMALSETHQLQIQAAECAAARLPAPASPASA